MPSSALPPDLAARRRRARLIYAAVVVVAVLAVGLTMGLVIGTGEAAHATLRTGTAAPAVPGGTLRASPTEVWRTSDRAASNNPLWVGTVVTWSDHTLAGRDATTGAIRWSYTRTDLSICDAAQRNGRAFVLFGRDGDCDELSTFDAQTGTRGWFRTMPDVGEGRLEFGGTGLVVSYPTSFHAIREVGGQVDGVDRFPSVPTTGSDCRFTSVVPGETGVLASERCADGEHLALWSNDGAEGQPQRLWRVPVTDGIVAIAETAASAFGYDPVSGAVTRYAQDLGTAQDPLALDPATTGPAGTTLRLGSDLLLALGDRVYDLSEQGVLRWSAPAAGTPTTVDGDGTRVLVPTAGAVQDVDVTSGETVTTTTLPATTGSDPAVYAAGGGLLVADPTGLAYLR